MSYEIENRIDFLEEHLRELDYEMNDADEYEREALQKQYDKAEAEKNSLINLEQ